MHSEVSEKRVLPFPDEETRVLLKLLYYFLQDIFTKIFAHVLHNITIITVGYRCCLIVL